MHLLHKNRWHWQHSEVSLWSTATVSFHIWPAYFGLNKTSDNAPPIELMGIESVKCALFVHVKYSWDSFLLHQFT